MTPEEAKEYGKKEITITRERVAEIIAFRLAEETVTMEKSNLSPVVSAIFSDIMTHICADIMSEMFGEEDDELEVEE